MSAAFISHLQSQIEATKEDGLYKKERVITSHLYDSFAEHKTFTSN